MPNLADRPVAAVGTHLFVHAVGGLPQGEFTQGDQVSLAEKIADRPLGLFRHVDFAVLERLRKESSSGVDVHEHNFVGLLEHVVRYRFPDTDAGNAADYIVEALQVLDVDGSVDVDAGSQQFIDVLAAFWMARALHIGVRQFVYQEQGRTAFERAINIKLLKTFAAILDFIARQHFQTFQQRHGFGPAVGFDETHHHIQSLCPKLARST